MSFWDNVKGLLGGKPGGVARDADRLYIVDVERLAESRGGVGPVERVQALQRLAQFAAREKIRVQAVVGGRPLREVAHGEELNGLPVYYSEEAGGAAEQILKLYKPGALVITSDAQVEERIRSRGGETMRTSTLRKAIEGEGGGGGGQDGRGDRGPRRRQDRPPRRDRGDRGDRPDRGDHRPQPPREPQGPEGETSPPPASRPPSSTDTTVKSLIDLVE
jgi:hypothetical protein